MVHVNLTTPLKILAIIDASPHSTATTNLLTQIVWPPRTEIHLLSLVPGLLPTMDYEPEARRETDEVLEITRWRDWASAKLLIRQVSKKLLNQNVIIESEICEQQSAKMLLNRVVTISADLLVTGAKWFSTPGDVEVEPIIRELAHQADCSILLTRPSAQIRPLGTLLAVDASTSGKRVVDFLGNLSLPEWARSIVVNVIDEKIAAPMEVRPSGKPEPAGTRQMSRSFAESTATRVIDQLHSYHTQAKSITRFGYPEHEILSVAQEQNADLIVVSTPQTTQSRYNCPGSIIKGLISHAQCSVLVVR